MKKTLTIIFLLILAGSLHAQTQKDTLRILCIGNSFSVDATERNLWSIAHEDGRCLIIGDLYIGGCSLERHWNNMKNDSPAYDFNRIDSEGRRSVTKKYRLSTALKDEKWDVVTLQQASHFSGLQETYEPYLGDLVGYVKEMAPDSKIMWHMTWAYAKEATHPQFPNYGKDQAKMYEQIVQASKAACEKYSLEVIPCGTAIQNIRGTRLGENVTRDGFHLNFGAGCYAASCTVYKALTGRTVTGNACRIPHLSEEWTLMAQLAAESAVREPWKVSEIGFNKYIYNKDEDQVGEYTLPDPLIKYDGTPVTDAKTWMGERKPELLEAFTREMYGRMPESVKWFETKVLETRKDALEGLATRKRVAIYLNKEHSVWIDLMVYTPNGVKQCPMFLGINFWGNDRCTLEEDVKAPSADEARRYGIYNSYPRGYNARRWPLEMILRRGYGVAFFYRSDVEPDFDDTNNLGVQRIYPREAGKGMCAADQWGSISAWAWGLSRAMDYLVTDTDVNPQRVAVMGHSRLGKTALWAGANDPRFAMVVANDSGCGGAALSRRNFGETVTLINRSFPHWFCDNFKKYGGHEEYLPFDQHELIALCAPRPVCIGSASKDFNADPEGERLSLENAKPVYELFGEGFSDRLQYHRREGGHDILPEDWQYYLDHADKYMK